MKKVTHQHKHDAQHASKGMDTHASPHVSRAPAANPTAAKPPKTTRNPKPQKAQPCTINVYALPTLRMHNMEPVRPGASDHLNIGRVGMPC